MIGITKRRMFLASLASAAAFFVLPAFALFVGWMQMPFLNPDGTPDNAPVRGAGIFVLISPALFVLLTAFTFLGAVLLQRNKRLRPTALASIVVIASFGLGALMALDQPFGWYPALISFGVFSTLVLVALGFSAWVWWKVAMRPNSTVERDGPQAARSSP